MRYLMVLIATLLVSHQGLAAGGHGGDGIPNIVWFQFFNFGLLIALLYFLLRKPVKEFFANRHQDYQKAMNKAQEIRKEAEKLRDEIKVKIEKIEAEKVDTFEMAKKDAEELKAKILKEAEDMARQIREEARRSAENEIHRAKEQLKMEILEQATDAAKSLLKEKTGDTEEAQLRNRFVSSVGSK
jgi:F-type H+-transporting ATPase subunit b